MKRIKRRKGIDESQAFTDIVEASIRAKEAYDSQGLKAGLSELAELYFKTEELVYRLQKAEQAGKTTAA